MSIDGLTSGTLSLSRGRSHEARHLRSAALHGKERFPDYLARKARRQYAPGLARCDNPHSVRARASFAAPSE